MSLGGKTPLAISLNTASTRRRPPSYKTKQIGLLVSVCVVKCIKLFSDTCTKSYSVTAELNLYKFDGLVDKIVEVIFNVRSMHVVTALYILYILYVCV